MADRSRKAPETSQRAPEAPQEAPEGNGQVTEETQGYSGSGSLTALLSGAVAVGHADSLAEAKRLQAAADRQAELGATGRQFAETVLERSTDETPWVRFPAPDQDTAKRLRRVMTVGSELLKRNFRVEIGQDSDGVWFMEARPTQEGTGRGRPKKNG